MALEVQNLTVVYNAGQEDEVTALRGLNLTFERGEITAVVGEMGSGKSTLADHLNGLLQPTSGTVLLDGRDVATFPDKREVTRRVGYVMQQAERQIFCQTVKEEISFAPRNFCFTEEQMHQIVATLAKNLEITEEILEQDPLRLSSGQKRIVAIASVLAQKPDYLVLDEPTAGLDNFATRALLRLLCSLKQKGLGIIFITHDMEIARLIADKFIVLDTI